MLAALLAGCGGDTAPSGQSSGSSAGAERTTATQRPAPRLSAAAQARADARRARADARRARQDLLELERTFVPNPWREPAASPPHPHGTVKHLIVHEVKRGRGPALHGDEVVYANFVKTYWKSGRKFLVAWGPARFEYLDLPSQALGISRGMTGMRPGGRRTIVMPRAIGDVHDPDGTGWEIAHVDIVLRQIVPRQ
jgi:hypothetical protein